MSAFVQYLISGIALGCSFALVGAGFVVIHRVTSVINFAQGTFVVVAGLAAASFLGSGAMPHGLAEISAIALAGVAGLVVGVIAIAKPGTPALISLVVTLGCSVLAYAIEIVVWGDQPISFPGLGDAVVLAGARIRLQYLLIIAVTVVTFVMLGLFFGRSYLGKALTACSNNAYAARLAGINVTRMGLFAFTLAGMLGGLAGVLITPLQPVAFDSDVTIAINGFAAAIFGGLMRPMVALTGGVVLGVAEQMVAGYISNAYQLEVALVVMLTLMIWQASRRSGLVEDSSL